MHAKTGKSSVMESMDGLTTKFQAMLANDVGPTLSNAEATVVIGVIAGLLVGIMNRDISYRVIEKIADIAHRLCNRELVAPELDEETPVNSDAISLRDHYAICSRHSLALQMALQTMHASNDKLKTPLEFRKVYLQKVRYLNMTAPIHNQPKINIETDFANVYLL